MRLLIFALATLFVSVGISQIDHAQGTYLVNCDEIVYDDGGAAGNYSNGLDDTMTLVFPSYVVDIDIVFGAFSMGASENDSLIIFEGTGPTQTLVGKYVGNTVPGPVTIANDTIILIVKTDGSANFAGFELIFSGQFDGSTAAGTDKTCDPVDNGIITFTATGGSSPYLYSVDSASTWQTSNAIGGQSIGTNDDLLVQDLKGCIDSVDAVTIADASVAFTFVETANDISCNGLTNGNITVNAGGSAGGNYMFYWSTGEIDGPATNGDINTLAAGNYSVIVADDADTTCQTTRFFIINEPAVITETHFILDTISCNNECDGSIAFTPAGGTPPYQFSDDNGVSFQNSSVLDSLCAGTIDYVVEDANGCQTNGSQVLAEPVVLTVATAPTNPTGAGANDGFINSTPAGGTTPYTYLWSTVPLQTNQNATGLGGGTYTVTVTDSNGCTAQSSETLFEPALFDGGIIEFAGGAFYELVCHGFNTSAIQNNTLPSGGTPLAGPPNYNYRWQWSTDLSNWNTFGAPTTDSYGVYTPTADVFIRRMAIDALPDTSYSNALTINYTEEVFPSITGLDTTYCQNDPFVVMNGSPASGTSYFTVNGFDTTTNSLAYFPTDTILQDTSTHIDTNLVSYTYVDNNGCIFTTTPLEFYIYDTVYFDLEFFQTEYIIGESNVFLPDKVTPWPSGGSYIFTGPGASGDSLYLEVAGLGGNKSYRITYTDTTGCTSTDTDSIDIVMGGAISGLGDFLFCNDEANVSISATDPSGSFPANWTPGTPNYSNFGPALTFNSGFRLFDANGTNISGLALASGGTSACCSTIDNDVIDLSSLPVTPGQFLDTFRLEYRYQNRIQTGMYTYVGTFCFPGPVGTICIPWPYFYPIYSKATYTVSQFFYVEHLNSAGNFANLTPPYCQNIPPVNIIAENQDPLGGISEWTISTVAQTFDGISNEDQTTATFDPSLYTGIGPYPDPNTSYTINYIYKSPLEQCQASISGLIEVSDVPDLTLSQNTVSGAIPLTNELCLGESDTIYGFADGVLLGNFSGNNVDNDAANDGVAILNTGTTPAINEPITLTYTDANGCTTDSTWLRTIWDIPVVNITTALSDICYGDSVLLTGTGDGNNAVGNFYLNDGVTDSTTAGEAWFVSGAGLANAGTNYSYTYQYTDINGCTDSISDFIYVNELPVAGINVDGYEFCSNDTASVNPIPIPGDPNDSIVVNGTIMPYNPFGYYEIVAGNYPTGLIYVEYYYTDNNGCKAYAIDSLLVYPTPDVGFTFNSNCITDTIDFIDTTNTNGATIADYSWNFSDGFASGAQDTSVLFQYGGQKVITFEVTSTAGCSDSYQLIEWFGEKPRVDFSWTNECLTSVQGSNTRFTNLTPTIDSVTTWQWDFGDPLIPNSTQITDTVNYTQEGAYQIILYGETDYGCRDTAEKTIWIREYVRNYPYFAQFDDPVAQSQGWIPDTLSGVNNSWEWGMPNGSVIDSAYSGDYAMMTNVNTEYNANEYSFVLSPCFDFSSLKRPMIRMKMWGESQIGDGMKIEYGSQVNDSTYQFLGEPNKGINWYGGAVSDLIEPPSITAQYPNSVTSFNGWEGSTGGWIDVRYELDTILTSSIVNDTMVRFKIIFGSGQFLSADGFAIDDIWIGERERTVLVEHFTNYEDAFAHSESQAFNGVIDDPIINDERLDVVNIQYHTRQSDTEMLNTNYASGPAARQNYYGLDSIPYCINDGISFRGDVADWFGNMNKLEARTLIDPQFHMGLNVTRSGANGENIDVQVDFEALEDLGQREIVVRIAIVEDSIDLSGNGVTGYNRNTLLDFLPGASGTSFSNFWVGRVVDPVYTAGTAGSVFESTTVTNGFNYNNIDVVAWIQDKDSKEVYQAISGTISSILGLTGVHDETAAMDFIIYPNPTNTGATLLLNNTFKERGTVYVHDASGRLIETITIDKFQEKIDLKNNDYQNGIYFVSVINPNGQKMTKKMVVSKN